MIEILMILSFIIMAFIGFYFGYIGKGKAPMAIVAATVVMAAAAALT